MKPIVIAGMGLAGACIAWHLWFRGVPFRIVDRGYGGSSRVAAGLVNPVSGKNCTVPAQYAENFSEAQEFFRRVESMLDQSLWHPLEVIRLLPEKEAVKLGKKLADGDAAEWVIRELIEHPWANSRAYLLHGGARLDSAAFVDHSRAFFSAQGFVETGLLPSPIPGTTTIWCEGSEGLIQGHPLPWRQRCAKGEILTVRAPSWQQTRMITGRGWLVPLGDNEYKIGATYDWNRQDEIPTEQGLAYLQQVALELGGSDFEILAHQAGLRPIVRKSQPVAGSVGDNEYVFNGLGSKGSLKAPWAARCLVAHLLDGVPLDSSLSLAYYFETLPPLPS